MLSCRDLLADDLRPPVREPEDERAEANAVVIVRASWPALKATPTTEATRNEP
jgi:hypothetical protein